MKKVSILALVVLLLGSMVFAAGSKEEAAQGP